MQCTTLKVLRHTNVYTYIYIFTLTLAPMVPGPILTRWGSSGCIPEYPSGLGGASSSLILSTDSLLRCRVLANDGSQGLDLAQSCSSRKKNETSNCASPAFAIQQSRSQLNTEAADLAHELVRCWCRRGQITFGYVSVVKWEGHLSLRHLCEERLENWAWWATAKWRLWGLHAHQCAWRQ